MKNSPASGASARPAKPARAHVPPGEIRIIGGLYKRSKIAVPDKPGLRPTPNRVRETLFNWLGQDLTGWHCVDAFAGTGALGWEAASRGAAAVLMGEQDAELVQRLKAFQQKLGADAVRIERGDGLALLRRLPPRSQQLILLDPPFDSELFAPALQAAAQALADPGYLYLEAPQPCGEDALAGQGLALLKQGRAGQVHFHLLVRAPDQVRGA
jgi:16S rRNA (guanine(966)-N(2))-methyltransferase RsmD